MIEIDDLTVMFGGVRGLRARDRAGEPHAVQPRLESGDEQQLLGATRRTALCDHGVRQG